MANIRVYYEEILDIDAGMSLAPTKIVIHFGRGNIPWDKNFIYFPLLAPFKRQLAEDFNSDEMSVTINIDDLTINPGKPNYFGIFLPRVVSRIERHFEEERLAFKYVDAIDPSFNLDDIESFILQLSDIEEVMKMNVNQFYQWESA